MLNFTNYSTDHKITKKEKKKKKKEEEKQHKDTEKRKKKSAETLGSSHSKVKIVGRLNWVRQEVSVVK